MMELQVDGQRGEKQGTALDNWEEDIPSNGYFSRLS